VEQYTTYSVELGEDSARALQRAGRWDDALAVLPAGAAALRAHILADRFWWRLGNPAEAEAAAGALAPHDPGLAEFCCAQLAYTRIVFAVGTRPGDRDLARHGFISASADARLAGWGTFWLGVLADNVDHSPAKAIAAYTPALAWARQNNDRMLESYAVRHLGDHALANGDASGLDLLRKSYHLRAALGARPHTAAAAATLSAALPPGAEASQLHETALLTARELQLTWLLNAL
jgi:hypothetical protein